MITAAVNDVGKFTATVTTGSQPPDGRVGQSPSEADFMSAVVAWPAADEAGYVNLHYSRKDGIKKPQFGWPFRDISSFIKRTQWIASGTSNFCDAWYCLSLQSKSGVSKSGKPKAERKKQNALSLKAIWIDIDVGNTPDKPDRHYDTIEIALKAVMTFLPTVGLPTPSAIVGSGGGLHVYWISHVALTPAEWRPYADGLKQLLLQHSIKCDTGLTTDAARLLRVPGTMNYKYDPPKPVHLLNLPLVIYDFAASLGFLTTLTPITVAVTPTPPPYNPFFEGVDPASFGKPAFALNDGSTLGAGTEKRKEFSPLNPSPVFQQCPFMRGALANGGADLDNPLWNLSVLCTTFMENGNVLAHEISKGHAAYAEADTQALYDRKVAERADRGIGYPSCATIAGAGCEACKTCPLFTKGKSPLNIRPAVSATSPNAACPSGSSGHANWTDRSGISFSNIPHRQWLYGFDLVRGELTVIGSPGGVGKSSLAIGMAICSATGRELLQEKIRGNNLKALIINGEDSSEEILRRVFAFCLAHGIVERDLQNLTFVGADDAWVQQISFLTTNERGASALNQRGLDAFQSALDVMHPDVIVLDPLVSFCGGGNMNDNAIMSLAMRKLKELAARYKCAVLIVHHTTKRGEAGNVETISGAAAITNLARRAIMPAPLTDADSRLGILPSERSQYFKLVDAKSNLVPRAVDSPLYRLQNVELPNPEPPLYPNGDNVQAITRVVLPIQPSGAASADDMKIEGAIFALVDRGKEIDGQFYPYSASPAGAKNLRPLMPDATIAVANATAPRQWPPGDLEAVIRSAIEKMKTDGRIVEGELKDIAPDAQKRFRKGRGLKAVPI